MSKVLGPPPLINLFIPIPTRFLCLGTKIHDLLGDIGDNELTDVMLANVKVSAQFNQNTHKMQNK